jgi:hypothetical protein
MLINIEKARNALHDLENNWLTIINEINQDKTRQIPREEGNRIRITCRDAIEQFIRVYTPEIDADREFGLEVTNTNSKLHSRLDITLLEGKRRYENELHRRKIESINAWGTFLNNIKFNIVSLILGIISTAIYFLVRQ